MQPAAAVVCGVDFSASSADALEAAIRQAKRWHARLALVHAIRPLGAPGLDLGHPQFQPARNESADVAGSAQPGLAERWLERARRSDVEAELVSRPGHPDEVLLSEARRLGARAIFVGSGGGAAGTGFGSVARAVQRKSEVPVVVVPAAA